MLKISELSKQLDRPESSIYNFCRMQKLASHRGFVTHMTAAEIRRWSKGARRRLAQNPKPALPARPFPMSGVAHVPPARTFVGTLIHALTLSLIAFNLAWGVYLMTVTYSMSIGLFFFSSLATLLPCVAAAIYFYSLAQRR